MKENRYFQMIYLLLEKGSMTAPELAKHFEVSVRTIYRDIDILSAAGIPIYATRGKGGGIAIQNNFVLNKSILSEQEQKQILLALQGIKIVDDENTTALLSKLSGAFQKQNVNWLEIDFSSWKRGNAEKNTFHVLQSAIFKSKRVSFNYHSGRGETVKRLVEPLKMVFKNTDWYLYGYCRTREDFRLFKLTRIRTLEMTSDEYIRPIPNQIFTETENLRLETIPVTLLFDKSISFRVYDEFNADNITENLDGNLQVETNLPDNEMLFSYVFSFGDKVEVIAPKDKRDEIAVRAKNIQNKYIT